MDHKDMLPQDSTIESTNQDSELYTNESEQLYQSFSPFDLSEILSREAEMIEKHYSQSRGWNLWSDDDRHQLRGKQYIKKRGSR